MIRRSGAGAERSPARQRLDSLAGAGRAGLGVAGAADAAIGAAAGAGGNVWSV